MKELGELITAMVTPFDDNLEVDYKKASLLAEKLIEDGSDGLVVVGTTGESPTLSKDEKLKLFKTVRETISSKGSVIAGTGSNCTRSTVELSKAAEQTGVDALLVVAPYYNKPPQEGLYEHFASVAKSVKLPIVLYNIPGRTGININTETIEKLFNDFSNIVAVKDSTGNFDQLSELAIKTKAVAGLSRLIGVKANSSSSVESNKREFRIYSGDDSLTLPVLACGGTGVISVSSHIVGKRMKEMIVSFFEGKVNEAKRIHLELMPIFKALFLTANPILVKEAMNIKGFNVGGLRPPLLKASSELREKLSKVMKNLGIL